jgi:hypothetical protein
MSASKAMPRCWRKFFLVAQPALGCGKDLGHASPATASRNTSRRPCRGARQQLHDAAANLSKAAAEYCTEKHPVLAKPQQVAAFIQQVDKLRDDVARLSSASNNCRPRGIIDMMRLLRLLKIIFVAAFRAGRILLAPGQLRWLRTPLNLLLFMRNVSEPRAVSCAARWKISASIFVKFGQMLPPGAI